MRTPKFRFEKILTYRRHLERQKQRDLAEAQKLAQARRQTIVGLKRSREKLQMQRKEHLVGDIKASRLSGYYRYLVLLQQMEKAGRTALQEAAETVDAKADGE